MDHPLEPVPSGSSSTLGAPPSDKASADPLEITAGGGGPPLEKRDWDCKGKSKAEDQDGVIVIEGEVEGSSSEGSTSSPRVTEIALAAPPPSPPLPPLALDDLDGVLVTSPMRRVAFPSTGLGTGFLGADLNSQPSMGRIDSEGRVSVSTSFASSQRPILSARESELTTGTGTTADEGSSRPSWKKGGGRRAVETQERKRLAALGFEEELARDFDFWASWGLGMCNIGFLPGTLLGVLTAVNIGGGSMYAFAWPLTGLFMAGLAAVLGEMASSWPVAGAMFTWTFRLCRSSRKLDGWARYASWIIGSYLLCSHVLIQIVLAYQLSHVVQGLISVYVDTFQTTFWQSMGIGWGVLAFSGVTVSSSISRSPMLWRVSGILIIVGFLTMNIVLLVHAKEIRPASYVFLSYGNGTGFSSKAYVYLIGWVLTCIDTGLEACAHMAEDTKHPARTVPLAMFWSTAISYLLGWMSICVVLATANTTGMDPRIKQPSAMLINTLPRGWTTFVVAIILFSLIAQNVAQLLATSRFIWALARESALPFSTFFRHISKSQGQPLPAIWVVVIISALSLLLIGISVSIVGTILLEGAGWSVMAAYIIPVALYLFCPTDALAGDGRAQWTLRAFSKPVAWGVTAFGCLFLIVVCFPTGYPVTRLSASYSSGIAVCVLFLSTLTWVFYGNARYAGPIKTSTRWTLGAEVELPSSTSFKTQSVPPAAGATTSAAHGRSAHVFSSFPTVRSNDAATYDPSGATTTGYTSGDYSSAGEESGVSLESTEYWRQRGRWLSGGELEQGVRGRMSGPPPGATP